MNKIPYPVKLALFLVILGGICGALLATVNSFTAPIIEELKIEQVRTKLEQVVPFDNVSYTEITDLDKVKGIVTAYSGKIGEEEVAIVYHGRIQGFASTIEALVSVDVKTGNILGISIVSEKETSPENIVDFDYGLPGKSIDDVESNFIPIGGATVSTEAIRDLVLNVQAQYARDRK